MHRPLRPLSVSLRLAFILPFVINALAFAQSTPTSGVVVDARTGQPLPGVVVRVEDTAIEAVTTADGTFTLEMREGAYVLSFSLVGFALARHSITVTTGAAAPDLRVVLSEGAGAFSEEVTVIGRASAPADEAPGGAALHGRDLQALRGVVMDDPLRALQQLPSASATNDFYSEFAVRGLEFRYANLTVDGIPSRYLMHSVHGVPDGGSIAMLNSDAVDSMSLLPGSYAQRFGRRLGAQVDVTTREGNRERRRVRAGLSGTSASLVAEGPLANGRGTWLLSARRSYLDLILNRIEADNSFGFGFYDTQAKLVWDATPRHQLQAMLIAGRSKFEESTEDLVANDEARVTGRSWLTGLAWRYTPNRSAVVTQRVFTTGLFYDTINPSGEALNRSRSTDFGWRGTATFTLPGGHQIDAGGDLLTLAGRHDVQRSVNNSPTLLPLDRYHERAHTASAYGQVALKLWPALTLTPGVRADFWGLTNASTASPWMQADLKLTPGTTLRAGGGRYRQFPDFEQVHGLNGGGTSLRPETADHLDLSVIRSLPGSSSVQVTGFGRRERDMLWTPGREPRRLADGAIAIGRGDAPFVNGLDGRASGVELVVRRDAPRGIAGWVGYAYTRHRYTDTATGDRFWADVDQRHALSTFAYFRLSNRSTLGTKFRYGSNYPRTGYFAELPPAQLPPPLFGGNPPLFLTLSGQRNALRLPAYARADVRYDRTYQWDARRVTLFIEVANVTNRHNLRNTPYAIDRNGRVFDGTDGLLPILPSAGFVVEF
jgi:hypothetical protein